MAERRVEDIELDPLAPTPAPKADGRERAVLVGLDRPGQNGTLADRLAELELLADTARCDAVARLTQARPAADSRSFIGRGKLDELKTLVEDQQADVVIVDSDLTPAQARTMEETVQRSVIDRTQLILDIFAVRASTRLARDQVELAQLQYELPRFRRMWTHLSRIEGGVGMRGPGETQLEVDRRRARDRIHRLEERLSDAEQQKSVSNAHRDTVFTVSLVGYTNVGKSTLMNRLTDAGVLVENRLFATLDATTRRLELEGEPVLLSDTVGFIRDLPHSLVASFHATLSEVRDADLLLHVVDISSPELEQQIDAVRNVLTEIGAQDQATLTVFNKCDALPAGLDAESIAGRFGGGVLVSAATGQGVDELKTRLLAAAHARKRTLELLIPYSEGKILAGIEQRGRVLAREYRDAGTWLRVLLDPADAGRVARFAAPAD